MKENTKDKFERLFLFTLLALILNIVLLFAVTTTCGTCAADKIIKGVQTGEIVPVICILSFIFVLNAFLYFIIFIIDMHPYHDEPYMY